MEVFLSFLALFFTLIGCALGWLEVNKLKTQIEELQNQTYYLKGEVNKLKYRPKKRYSGPKPPQKQVIKG